MLRRETINKKKAADDKKLASSLRSPSLFNLLTPRSGDLATRRELRPALLPRFKYFNILIFYYQYLRCEARQLSRKRAYSRSGVAPRSGDSGLAAVDSYEF